MKFSCQSLKLRVLHACSRWVSCSDNIQRCFRGRKSVFLINLTYAPHCISQPSCFVLLCILVFRQYCCLLKLLWGRLDLEFSLSLQICFLAKDLVVTLGAKCLQVEGRVCTSKQLSGFWGVVFCSRVWGVGLFWLCKCDLNIFIIASLWHGGRPGENHSTVFMQNCSSKPVQNVKDYRLIGGVTFAILFL